MNKLEDWHSQSMPEYIPAPDVVPVVCSPGGYLVDDHGQE